ncbi:MAG TPA: PBP1A family penicillin-binding protein [Syntrophomonas sp.]|nr:PBP1A family penicillin-binding protein [Syntrophomonas sp.]HRW11813.1 PBP1A family penicillin-binding protein [Syntrophomonas sp.]
MKFISKLLLAAGAILLFLMFFYTGVSLTQTTPKLAKFVTGISNWEYEVQGQTAVFYHDGKKMGNLGYQREYSEEFPKFMKDAVVAVEDKRFYEHSGFDSRSIGRAIYVNIRSGNKAEGGSTITQQLARTLFLSQEKTYWRKIKEVFIASAIEDKYTKDAILNMYLNEIYMGRGCTGMGIAARAYFGKDVFDLSKAEITALVGIIQSPEYYSPGKNLEGLKKRQQTVVNLLEEQGLLTAQEGQAIFQEELAFEPFRQSLSAHPYYMTYLARQLEKELGAQKLYQGGLKIYTTIDNRMQKAAEYAVVKQAATFAARGITAQDVALVAIEPQTGAVRAMVGGVEWDKNQINMAVEPRQPGSAIKPLYYAAAINEGVIQADTKLNNKPRSFNGYTPNNYAVSPEETTVRLAIVNSYNVASVEVLDMLGVNKAIKYLEKYGITSITKEDHNLALGLGGMSNGISPMEMASAYTMFANGGTISPCYSIERLVGNNGETLYAGRGSAKKVVDSSTAATMDSILKSVVAYGTGTPAQISIRSGGKTGTTTQSRDLWFMGYTSQLSTAVWVGNSNNQPVGGSRVSGGGTSALVWRDFMNRLISQGVLSVPSNQEPLEQAPVQEETPTEEEPLEELPPDAENLQPESPQPESPGDATNPDRPDSNDNEQPEDLPLPDVGNQTDNGANDAIEMLEIQ